MHTHSSKFGTKTHPDFCSNNICHKSSSVCIGNFFKGLCFRNCACDAIFFAGGGHFSLSFRVPGEGKTTSCLPSSFCQSLQSSAYIPIPTAAAASVLAKRKKHLNKRRRRRRRQRTQGGEGGRHSGRQTTASSSSSLPPFPRLCLPSLYLSHSLDRRDNNNNNDLLSRGELFFPNETEGFAHESRNKQKPQQG